MLVAVAVLMILMSGFTMLFTGSVRTVRTAMQQNDAYDQATGALSSIKYDLTSSFNGAGHGNDFSFYGTPIGMTFVGVVKNVSDNVSLEKGQADYRTARVTYVLYHDPYSYQSFTDAFYDHNTGTYHNGFTHRMLRYVEPNACDLDTFPVQWDTVRVSEGETMKGLIEWELAQRPDLTTGEDVEAFRRAKRCEYWIRMLAGGDDWEDGPGGIDIPNAWTSPLVCLGRQDLQNEFDDKGVYVVEQFVLTDSVATTVPPFDIPGFPTSGYRTYPFSGPALFNYDYARVGEKPSNGWWNDPRSINCQGGSGFCSQAGLPEMVSALFTLMFKPPYVSAPDYQHTFSMEINIPTAYRREISISGFVANINPSYPPYVRLVDLNYNDVTVSEIRVEANGLYSVPVPYGWSGRIFFDIDGNGLVEESESARLVNPRVYNNVTIDIENQDYELS